MKVVLFCGGRGDRMRERPEDAPKPVQPVGGRPLVWHVMRYYAHFGHVEFVLCLGHDADRVVDGLRPHLDPSWTTAFVDTGLDTAIGERLRRVRHLLDPGEVFAANYADVLTDAPLDAVEADFRASGAVGSLLAVQPQASFHVVDAAPGGLVRAIAPAASLGVRQNGGYFFFTPEIFDHLEEGDDLVEDGLARLVERGELVSWRHEGFWVPVDTAKERRALDLMCARGWRPWAVWSPDGTLRLEPLQGADDRQRALR